uniref:F-box domain-containing protein n=2 Tax=Panagrellus redivivus TaxID=6233 RepID=A0A7E4ZQR5_PANRE
MSNTTIKRFTYDWLIRFAELLPSDRSKFKLRQLSPLFTNLVGKYNKFKLQPILYITEGTNVKELLQSPNGDIWIPTNLLLWNVTQPGAVSTLMASKVSLCRIKVISVRGCVLTPEELLYLVKHCPTCEVSLDGTLTEPAYFSTIHPYLLRTAHVCLNLVNLIYDFAVPKPISRASVRPDAPRFLALNGIDFNNAEVLLKIVMSLPKATWNIQFNGTGENARMVTAKRIYNNLNAIGVSSVMCTYITNSLTIKM